MPGGRLANETLPLAGDDVRLEGRARLVRGAARASGERSLSEVALDGLDVSGAKIGSQGRPLPGAGHVEWHVTLAETPKTDGHFVTVKR